MLTRLSWLALEVEELEERSSNEQLQGGFAEHREEIKTQIDRGVRRTHGFGDDSSTALASLN